MIHRYHQEPVSACVPRQSVVAFAAACAQDRLTLFAPMRHLLQALPLKRERDRGAMLDAEAEEWLCGANALDGQFKG